MIHWVNICGVVLLHVGFMLRISKSWFHELLCRQTARFKFMRDFQAFFILVRSENLESPLWSEPGVWVPDVGLMLRNDCTLVSILPCLMFYDRFDEFDSNPKLRRL